MQTQLNERFAMHVIIWKVLVICCREAMEREYNEMLAQRHGEIDYPDPDTPPDGFPDD